MCQDYTLSINPMPPYKMLKSVIWYSLGWLCATPLLSSTHTNIVALFFPYSSSQKGVKLKVGGHLSVCFFTPLWNML